METITDWKTEAMDRQQILTTLADLAWEAVYEGRGLNWEYPVQAVRHLIAAYREAQEKVRVLEKIAVSAYATPEWRANHRTEETDEALKRVGIS